MSRGDSGRFQKGHSGNPGGRPKTRRPHISAFDIIFDKSLTVIQNGVARKLTIDEGLELQTYKAALGGSQMAIRKVLKMIEKRDAALAKRATPLAQKIKLSAHYCSDNANAAMEILDIAHPDPGMEDRRWLLQAWATQAALSRPGRKKFAERAVNDIKFFTANSETLHWPRGRIA